MAKKDADAWKECGARRQRIVEEASRAAFRVISEESDGSEEEENFLMAKMARSFMESALHPFQLAVWKHDRDSAVSRRSKGKTSGRYTVGGKPRRPQPRFRKESSIK